MSDVTFSDRHALVPRFDPDGRPYPSSLLRTIFTRMNEEDADVERTQEIADEEIARWQSERPAA